MKIKRVGKGVLAVLASACIAVGLGSLRLASARAEEVVFTDTDITEKLSISDIRSKDSDNFFEFFVNAGEAVGAYVKGTTTNWPGGGRRWVLNGSTVDEVKEAGCDILSYIEINGVAVRDILTEEGDSYGTFNKNDVAFDAYTPVMVNAEGFFTDGFHMLISKAYIEDENEGSLDNWTLTFKNGIVWNTVNKHALKTSADVTWEFVNGGFDKVFTGEEPSYTDVDITEKVKIERVLDTSGKNHVEFYVNVGETAGAYVRGFSDKKSWPGGGKRWVLNRSSVKAIQSAGCDILSFIEINGKNVRTILNEAGDRYGTFDKNDVAFDKYTPVMVNADGLFNDGFHMMISKAYLEDVNGGTLDNWTITIKSGIVWNNVELHALKTSADVEYMYYRGVFLDEEGAKKIKPVLEKDVTATTSVAMTGTDSNGCSTFVVTLGSEIENILPVLVTGRVEADGGYYVNDHAVDYGADVDPMEYILINGRPIRSIVSENSSNRAYQCSRYPMNYGGVFAPVSVHISSSRIYIEVMNAYRSWQNIRLTLKKGFEWTVKGDEENNYLLQWKSDINYGVQDGTLKKYADGDTVNLDNGLSVAYAGSTETHKRYAVSFAETFMSESRTVTDEMKDVVTVNGKTIAQLSGTIAELVYTNGKSSLVVSVLKSFIEQTPVVSIGLKPFAKDFLSLNHALTKAVEFQRTDGPFRRVYTVSFDGKDTVKGLEGVRLLESQIAKTPEKAGTAEYEYAFKGWYYTDKNGQEYRFEADKHTVLCDMALQAKFTARPKQYTVTLLNADGTPYATKKVGYGETLALGATPDKAHYTGSWVYQGEGKIPETMPTADLTFKAEYAPIVYSVTFYENEVGTKVLATQTYTIEGKDITAPEVVKKSGFAGVWEAYELNGGNLSVRPVYTATEADTTEEEGCSSVAWGVPAIGVLAVCALILRKRKEEV